MSDLSADDKRRAALWAAGWLGGQPVLYQEAANALRVYADPPDTVESLREQLAAERDHRHIAVVAGNQSNAELARLRVTHADTRTDLHKAKAEIYRLRAAVPVAEAAWARGREHWLGGDHSNQTPQDGKTLTDEDRAEEYRKGWDAGCRAGLTPVVEHPEPGTRGLLPVKVDVDNDWSYGEGFSTPLCGTRSETGRTILTDPRPGGGAQ